MAKELFREPCAIEWFEVLSAMRNNKVEEQKKETRPLHRYVDVSASYAIEASGCRIADECTAV
jgi:hypothetical protein